MREGRRERRGKGRRLVENRREELAKEWEVEGEGAGGKRMGRRKKWRGRVSREGKTEEKSAIKERKEKEVGEMRRGEERTRSKERRGRRSSRGEEEENGGRKERRRDDGRREEEKAEEVGGRRKE